MAQGKAWDKEKILESLEEYFKLGYNRNKACILANFDNSLLAKWEKQSPELSVKIDAWIEWPNTKARRNWLDKIEEKDYIASKDWLERRDKNNFSTKQEIDVRDQTLIIDDEED